MLAKIFSLGRKVVMQGTWGMDNILFELKRTPVVAPQETENLWNMFSNERLTSSCGRVSLAPPTSTWTGRQRTCSSTIQQNYRCKILYLQRQTSDIIYSLSSSTMDSVYIIYGSTTVVSKISLWQTVIVPSLHGTIQGMSPVAIITHSTVAST